MRSRSGSREAARFTLTLWTDEPHVALAADRAGVDRIGVDLEHLGKAERQAGLGTWISPHDLHDLERVGAVLERARLFARVNPLHDGTEAEVEAVLERGVDVVMLPMFRGPDEVGAFLEVVAGRAHVVLLLECAEALDRLELVLALPGVREIHLGLNDLSLSLGHANRFAVLADERVHETTRAIRGAGVRLGIGGLGRVDQEGLPVPADLLYAQQAMHGSDGALLARNFLPDDPSHAALSGAVTATRERLAEWAVAGDEQLAAADRALLDATAAAAVW